MNLENCVLSCVPACFDSLLVFKSDCLVDSNVCFEISVDCDAATLKKISSHSLTNAAIRGILKSWVEFWGLIWRSGFAWNRRFVGQKRLWWTNQYREQSLLGRCKWITANQSHNATLDQLSQSCYGVNTPFRERIARFRVLTYVSWNSFNHSCSSPLVWWRWLFL